MTDQPPPQIPPEGEEPVPPAGGEPYPWDEEETPCDDPDSPRQRHDAFTEARKCEFLRALVKTGGILDACRLVGPSPRTVYRHQETDRRFLEHCRIALRMSGAPVELTAWSRAVEGVEEEVAVAGLLVKRRRYDSNLLRLLLQASDPKKYGPRPGFKRKRLLRFERKQMEREIRADIEAQRKLAERSGEEAMESILRKIEAIERHEEPARLAAGWSKSPEGHWIPPGYGPIAGWEPPGAAGEAEDDPGDSL